MSQLNRILRRLLVGLLRGLIVTIGAFVYIWVIMYTRNEGQSILCLCLFLGIPAAGAYLYERGRQYEGKKNSRDRYQR